MDRQPIARDLGEQERLHDVLGDQHDNEHDQPVSETARTKGDQHREDPTQDGAQVGDERRDERDHGDGEGQRQTERPHRESDDQ